MSGMRRLGMCSRRKPSTWSLVVFSKRFLASRSERAASASSRAESASGAAMRRRGERGRTEVHDPGGEGVLEVQVLDFREHIANSVMASQRLKHRDDLLAPRHELESRVLEEL
jgi:hypothetical protein